MRNFERRDSIPHGTSYRHIGLRAFIEKRQRGDGMVRAAFPKKRDPSDRTFWSASAPRQLAGKGKGTVRWSHLLWASEALVVAVDNNLPPSLENK